MYFLKNMEKNSFRTCFIDDRKNVFLYKDVLRKADLESKKLIQRRLIFVLAKNHTDFITSYVGFLRRGLVQMLLNPDIDKTLLFKLLESYLPTYIFIPKSRSNDFLNFETLYELNDHKVLIYNKTKIYPVNKDLALLLATSGSTGSKKFVKITHQNIYDNTKNIIKYLKINKNHKSITTMPPFYTYGLSIINTHLYSGSSIVVTNKSIMQKDFWLLMKKYKVTSFGGVPFFYEILKKLNFNKIHLPHLKYFTQAGGPIDNGLKRYFLNYALIKKKKFIIMYGQVEATARMTYLPFNSAMKKIGSVGIPIPGGKVFLKKGKNKNAKEGEIIYKGKNASMGYANSFKDLNKDDENKGILSTGDLAYKDKDGYLFITGRKSRNVKLHGHRVNLDDLEKLLSKIGYKCLCYGFDNNITIFHSNKNYTESILKILSTTIKAKSNCFKLKYIKKFPTNESGKISYKNLKNFL